MNRKNAQRALQEAQEAYEAAHVAYDAANDRYVADPTPENDRIVFKASVNLMACFTRLCEIRPWQGTIE